LAKAKPYCSLLSPRDTKEEMATATSVNDTADAQTTPNLASTVFSAVGSRIFSFLPLGSLLNGYSSPLLVCKSFYENFYLEMVDREILDFSQCSHLRRITDEVLQNCLKDSHLLKYVAQTT
jgi:hypothetical protein